MRPNLEVVDNADFLLRSIIQDLKDEKVVAAVYSAFAYAVSVKDEKSAEYFQGILTNLPLLRCLGLLDSVKSSPDTAYEYFDVDRQNDPYAYQEGTEEELMTIRIHILTFVGTYCSRDRLADLFKQTV